MMICPKCEVEYQEGFTQCTDCKVDLVQIPSQETPAKSFAGKLVVIKTFLQIIDVHLARGKLESEGIECFIEDENIISANPLYALAVGGVKLLVKDQDVVLAKQLLEV